MPVKAMRITAEKEVSWVEIDGLASMQALVGGFIQRLELNDECSLYINEEGKLEQLPFNSIATDLALLNGIIFPTDAIVGDVFITGPGDGEGGDTDLIADAGAPHPTLRQLRTIIDEAGGRVVT